MVKAYSSLMQAKASSVRAFVAVFMAAILMLAVEPGALAMPAHHSATMQMTDCAHMAMGRAMPERGTPCKHMADCLGMLNCLAMAVVPVTTAAALPLTLTHTPSWHLQTAGPGITLQPDTPPPIA